MGCGSAKASPASSPTLTHPPDGEACTAYLPSPTFSPVAVPVNSCETRLSSSTSVTSTDDLGWCGPKGSEQGGFPEPHIPRIERKADRPTGGGIGADTGIMVQCLLEGGWRTCSVEETSQMLDRLGGGELKFQINARGQTYDIDFASPDGASQTNIRTGKKRRLRLMDASEAGDEARTQSFSSSGPRKAFVKLQMEYGAQSRRGNASQQPLGVLNDHPHAQDCFAKFYNNEARLCGDYAVFYHSYSFAALIYEVHAAVGSVLFRFRSQYGTLPRILVHEFKDIPDAKTLMNRFETRFAKGKKDHDPRYRTVGLSVMCSLVSTGPEACIPMVFVQGYSCKDLSFRSVLEHVLQTCYVPKSKVKGLAKKIIELSEKHGLDVSQFGGKPCKSGKVGHLLQIFIKRELVDQLCYAAKPYGPIDEERMPISRWMNSNESFSVGQARIVAHPKYLMQANQVRMFVASADPTFHGNRQAFQKELIDLLSVILGQPSLREKAAAGIYGGSLPSWWTSQDQRFMAMGSSAMSSAQ